MKKTLYFVGGKNSEKNNSYMAVASCYETAKEALERHRKNGADRIFKKSVKIEGKMP